MMRRFCAYIEKVFEFSAVVSRLKDLRQLPRIPTWAVWLSGFIMSVVRSGSLNSIAGELQIPRRFERMIGRWKPSAETIGRVFAGIPSDSLRDFLCVVNHRLKRNKLPPLKWPLRFVALDGHEFLSLTKPLLPSLSSTPYQGEGRARDGVLP